MVGSTPVPSPRRWFCNRKSNFPPNVWRQRKGLCPSLLHHGAQMDPKVLPASPDVSCSEALSLETGFSIIDRAIIVINKPPGIPVQSGLAINRSVDVLTSKYLRYDYEESRRLIQKTHESRPEFKSIGNSEGVQGKKRHQIQKQAASHCKCRIKHSEPRIKSMCRTKHSEDCNNNLFEPLRAGKCTGCLNHERGRPAFQ